MSKVVIVDYNIGNVFSVAHALKEVGADPDLNGSHEAIAGAERLILPGVGAFASAKAELDRRGLLEPILAFIDTGRPFLGICVGMQLLMEVSTEFGRTEGLGLIKGEVSSVPKTSIDGSKHPVPHIAWASLNAPQPHAAAILWRNTPLASLTPGRSACYFVHSFMAYPSDSSTILAQADYNGRTITAAVRRDNITGLQFHPERSGLAGQKVLSSFIDM